MSRKRERIGRVVAVALALGLTTVTLQAQTMEGGTGEGVPPQAGPPAPGRTLEIALQNADVLELTTDQVAQLEELKGILDEDVAPVLEEMRMLRQEIRTEEADRREGLRDMQKLRGRFLMASAPLRGRVQEILTVQQHRELLSLVWRSRPAAGRPGALRGRGGGLRGGPGGFWRGPGAFPGHPGAFPRGPGVLRGCPGFFPGRPGFFRGRPGFFPSPRRDSIGSRRSPRGRG